MGQKTKIDWCDASWNPVTGCRHGCEYCYARRIAERFGGLTPDNQNHVLEELNHDVRGNADVYPFGFAPTFHRYKLDELQHWKKPRTIFVCSMADLFGNWVPDKWILDVLDACKAAPQHRYLFLTKNPKRYVQLADMDVLPKGDRFWYGTSTPRPTDKAFWCRPLQQNDSNYLHTFVSVEPILEPFGAVATDGVPALTVAPSGWVIVGAETGNREGRVKPEKEWIMEILHECRRCGTPIFMKESLREIIGADFVQEYPWKREDA